MNQDFFTNLPSHLIVDIFTRLPVPSIARCKSVCKAWLDLLVTPHFAHHHLSKSEPGLAVYQREISSRYYKIYQLEDELNLDHHDLHYTPLTTFQLPLHGLIQGSANGLLFLRDLQLTPNGLSICNPITREYAAIQTPQEFDYRYPQVVTFGFGASRMSGQHKVVRIFHDSIRDQDCHVYTLGFGRCLADVFALGEYLCVCDNSGDDEIVIWLMKEYGNDKSWMKEFVLSKTGDFSGECYEIVRPIKVFKDGDILMAWGDFFMFYASSKNRSMTEIKMFGPHNCGAVDSILHTSSFLSIKSLGMENVGYF